MVLAIDSPISASVRPHHVGMVQADVGHHRQGGVDHLLLGDALMSRVEGHALDDQRARLLLERELDDPQLFEDAGLCLAVDRDVGAVGEDQARKRPRSPW